MIDGKGATELQAVLAAILIAPEHVCARQGNARRVFNTHVMLQFYNRWDREDGAGRAQHKIGVFDRIGNVFHYQPHCTAHGTDTQRLIASIKQEHAPRNQLLGNASGFRCLPSNSCADGSIAN